MSEWERTLFAKSRFQTTKWKNTKMNWKTIGEVTKQMDHFQELKPCLAFLLSPIKVNVVGDACPVHQRIVTNLSAVEMKLTKIKYLARKIMPVLNSVNANLQLIPCGRFTTSSHLRTQHPLSVRSTRMTICLLRTGGRMRHIRPCLT